MKLRLLQLKALIRQKLVSEGHGDRRRDFERFLLDLGRRPETATQYANVVEKIISEVNSSDDETVRKYIRELELPTRETWKRQIMMTAWNAFRQFLQLGSIQSDTIDHNLNAEIDQSAPLSEKMTSMIDDFIDHCSNAGSSRSSLRQYRTVLTRLLRSLEDGKDDPNVSDTLAREVINGLSADPADRRISMKIWRMWKEYLKISGKVPQYW